MTGFSRRPWIPAWRSLLVVVLVAGGLATAASPAAAQDPPPDDPPSALPIDPNVPTAVSTTNCLPDAQCRTFAVECPGLAGTATGSYRVRRATSAYRGALVLFSGSEGKRYWGGGRGSEFLIEALRGRGLDVIEVRWDEAWEKAARAEPAGARVGCRPASVVHHLRENVYLGDPADLVPGACGFCIAGSSGGASQAAYALSHFGLDHEVDGLFPLLGPVHSAMLKGCLPDRVWGDQYSYAAANKRRIDELFGFGEDAGAYAHEHGPCRAVDERWSEEWTRAGIDTGALDLVYDATRVHLVLGGNDTLPRAHAMDYVRALARDGSPWVAVDVVPGMGHELSTFTGEPENPNPSSLSDYPGLQAFHDAVLRDDPAAYPACNNGIDDDLDGSGDASDPGCTPGDPADRSENDAALACDDGSDQDGDGRTDTTTDSFGDPGCSGPADATETDESGTFPCDDGVDHASDKDALADFPADPGCRSPADAGPEGFPESEPSLPCDDGRDNGDEDPGFDADDPDCATPDSASESRHVLLASRSVSAAEGGTASFTVELSCAAAGCPQNDPPFSVTAQTLSFSAVAGEDFVDRTDTLTFDGVTFRTFEVSLLQDELDELDRSFQVKLSAPSEGLGLGRSVAIGRIDDDDAPPTISVSDASVTEGDTGTKPMPFDVTLSAASGITIPAWASPSPGSAQAGSDYSAGGSGVWFLPGATHATVAVPVRGDEVDEPTETFSLDLTELGRAAAGDVSGTGQILDDDPRPQLSIANTSAAEGDPATPGALSFVVTLSGETDRAVTVQYTTVPGTATADADYTPVSGELAFAPGDQSETISVPIIGDDESEPDETLTVSLSTPVNAGFSRRNAVGTIVDDDGSTLPTLSVRDASVTEPNRGRKATVKFTVKLSRASTEQVTVRVRTVGDSAKQGTDYTGVDTTLTFSPGETSKTVSVSIIGDNVNEPDEQFFVKLSRPVNATISDRQAVGTIVDND